MEQLFTDTVEYRKVFIFDCCHSGPMINSDHRWRGRTEILAACAPEVEASALKGSLFTEAIYEMFKKGTYSINQAHAKLCGTEMRDRYGLKKTPWYVDYGDRESHSTLIRSLVEPVATAAGDKLEQYRNLPIDLDGLKSLSDAMILVAVTFKGTAEGFIEQLENFERDWRGWFSAAPSHIDEIAIKACTLVKFHGVFDSNSCITIWSVPVWLWDAMAPSDNARYLGVIRSENLATILNDRPFQVAAMGTTLLKNAPPVSSTFKNDSRLPNIDEAPKTTEQPLSLPADENVQESKPSPPGSLELDKVESEPKKARAKPSLPTSILPPGKTPKLEPSRPESPKLHEADNDRKKADGRFRLRRKKPIPPEPTATPKLFIGPSPVEPHPTVPNGHKSSPKNASWRESARMLNEKPEPSLQDVMQDSKSKQYAWKMENRPTSKFTQIYLKEFCYLQEDTSQVSPYLLNSASDYPKETLRGKPHFLTSSIGLTGITA